MEFNVKDFLNLRTRILRNSVLNHLLIGYLYGTKEPIDVGTSIIRLEGRLRNQVRKSKGDNAKLPSFIKADIKVSLSSVPAEIMHCYQDFPPFYVKHNVALGKSYLSYLRLLSCKVCDLYSMNAAKADPIFSELPNSLAILLNSNHISTHFWKSGCRKRNSQEFLGEVDSCELESYHKALRQRLSDWRNFNYLLIKLISEKKFKIENSEKGQMIATCCMPEQQVHLFCSQADTSRFFSYIVDYHNLSPAAWDYEKDNLPEFLKVMEIK